MNVAIILVVCAVLALVSFALVAWKSRRHGNNAVLREIDLDAFANLISAQEEEFLAAHLSAGEFRTIQRDRLRAAREYVSSISHNAGVLLHQGAAALRSPDPEIAEVGKRVIEDAGRLRLNAQLAHMKLLAAMLWPGTRLEPSGVLEPYRHLKQTASVLEHSPSEMAQAV